MAKTFSTSPFDWFNFIAQNYNSNALIQFVLAFKEPLDFPLLQRALQHCVVADPILGCIYNDQEDLPQWEPVSQDISKICRHIATNDSDAEITRLLAERIDASCECPVKIALITNDDKTVLVVKLHHALCDAGGALQFVRLLAEMYSNSANNTDFAPQAKTPKRGTEDFYEFFEVRDKADRFNPAILPDMQSTWGTPSGDVVSEQSFAFQKATFDANCLNRIRQFAKAHDSSYNAVITAAYHRALAKILKPSESNKEIQFSVNLRHFSKSKQQNSLCNFSNLYNVQLPTQGSFADSAKAAKISIDKILEPEMILQSVMACELLSTNFKTMESYYAADWERVKETGLCTPMISNIGRLDNEPISFAGKQPVDMYIVSPSFIGPSFMLSVGTYKEVMTLFSAYYQPSTSEAFVAELLHEISDILMNL